MSVRDLNEKRRSASPADNRELRTRTPPGLTSLATDHLTHCRWPGSSKLTVDITASELSSFLAYAQTLTPAYIHPRPISFADSTKKANWANHIDDVKERDYYDCLRRSAPRSSNRLALFATWTRSWVGREWEDDDWHCWGAAMLDHPTGYGKHLVIFDNEADMDQDFTKARPHLFMLPTQKQFIDWANKCYHIKSIWYGNAGSNPEPRQCVLSTAIWIESFSPRLEPKFQGSEDPRLMGFAEIKLR